MHNKQGHAAVNKDTANPNAPARPKSPWLRRLLLLAGAGVILLVILVLLIPTLLSTGVGKGFVFGSVSDSIAGEIEVDTLGLGWFGGQQMTGLVVRAEDGSEIARVGRISLPDASLFGLLTGGLAIGETRIENVTADLVAYDDGTTNLQRALAPKGGTTQSPTGGAASGTTGGASGGGAAAWPTGLSFDLIVRDVELTYRAHDVSTPIRASIAEADFSGADPTQLLFRLNAEFAQGDRAGNVAADAQVDGLFDGSGRYQPDAASAQINSNITDLPTDLLDTLLSQGGKLSALLGPVINGDIKAEAGTTGGTATLTLLSEHLKIDGGLSFNEQQIVGVGTSRIRLTVTPDAWAVISTDGEKPPSTLTRPVELAIALNAIDLPMSDAGLQLADARIDLDLTIQDAGVNIDKVGMVELSDTAGMLRSDALGTKLVGQFTTTSAINGKPGGGRLDIELADLIDNEQQLSLATLSAKVNGNLTHAPVAAILDELMPHTTHGLATRALGPTIDADFNLTTAPTPYADGVAGSFSVDLLTTGGEAGLLSALIGTFSAGKEAAQLDLADGSYVKFEVTPGLIEAYQAAFPDADADTAINPGRVTLAEPTALRLTISDLYSRFVKNDQGAYTIDPASARITARLRSPQIKLNQRDQLAATLGKLRVDIQSEGLSADTRMITNVKVSYPATNTDDAPRPGLIESATNIQGLINTDGEVDTARAAYQTVTRIQQAPIDLIDALFGMDGELVAAVGPRALMDITGAYQPSADAADSADDTSAAQGAGSGGFDLLLKSRTASADMKLLVEEGRWTLKADAPLSFQVTPRLSQTVLKKVNPFLGDAVSAKLPIGVTIRQKGFSVPLDDPAIGDVNADIHLALGELDLRGEGVLRKLLEQLGVGDRSLLSVGFSPVTINLAEGKLAYQDFTMTMGDVVLGFAGQVDLNSEQLDLKMTIPGSSLSHIKWLKGTIDPSQVIVVPLGGTFDRPTLDFKLLSGEIAKAALKGRLEGVAGEAIGDKIGGRAGSAVGGLLNDLLTGDSDILNGAANASDTPTDSADSTDAAAPTDSADPDAQPQAAPAKPELTAEQRAERKERRRLRRERLEREQQAP